MKITETILDVSTNEIITKERDLSAAEIATLNRYADKLAIEKTQQAEAEAKRQALLDRLGITADEARLLLG